MKKYALFGSSFFVCFFAFFSFLPNPALAVSSNNFGVVVLGSVGSIGIIDGSTQTATAPLLTEEFGSVGDTTLDVAISPDGNTSLVSNFNDQTVYFVDTSDPDNPEVTGNVALSFNAEDIAFTPDGKFAVVTDGGLSQMIAVIDIAEKSLVEEYDSGETENPLHAHQAVTVAPDGETVLTTDYLGGEIHAFTLSGTGHLTYVSSVDVSNEDTNGPLNIAVSPDGETAIIASVSTEGGAVFPVITITSPGVISFSSYVTPSISLDACQSVIFNHSGTKAYLSCVEEGVVLESLSESTVADTMGIPLGMNTDPSEVLVDPHKLVIALNVTGVGTAIDANTPVDLGYLQTNQLFGVDTLALDSFGDYLYASNIDFTDAVTYLTVIDTGTNTIEKTISFDPVVVGDPAEETDAIPVGISFFTDTTPPNPFAFAPTTGSTVNTNTPTITFETNEAATCRVSLSDESYTDMDDDVACDGGGTTNHSCTMPALGGNGTYDLYIACIDLYGNFNDEDTNVLYTLTLAGLAETGRNILIPVGGGIGLSLSAVSTRKSRAEKKRRVLV